ncbi:hypothetical protein SAMN02910301_2134 [Lachnospiraceae bacterium XBD2001]|nr:hypothetical protein SAMN02910301_2134 [Lachnospiraceae bacterium XBD2001]
MKRNALRIVCNPISNNISYYFKNEIGEWCTLSDSSPLSRSSYKEASLEEKGSEIVKKIDEVYNRKDKGLDIIFEGEEKDYKLFEGYVKSLLSERNVTCVLGATKIIVAGKLGSGKTVLIEAMENLQKTKYKKEEFEEYYKYSDENNTEWYEIKGIDFGKENIANAHKTICRLVEKTSGMIVYCINSSTSRMEESEKAFIQDLIFSFPALAGMIVVTQCNDKKKISSFVDEIEKIANGIKVVPVLAQEFETDIENNGKMVVLKPFGLDKLASYIFEGK